MRGKKISVLLIRRLKLCHDKKQILLLKWEFVVMLIFVDAFRIFVAGVPTTAAALGHVLIERLRAAGMTFEVNTI